MSAALGLGTARLAAGTAAHEAAARLALQLGVRHVDTSPGYGDGAAERLVGAALRDLDGAAAAAVRVWTKAGYLFGAAAAEAEAVGAPVAAVAQDCGHSLHPAAVRAQLAASAARLGGPPTALLLQDPERLALALPAGEGATAAMRDGVLQAFVALEQEVAAGRLGAYGVSSASWASPDPDPEEPEGELSVADLRGLAKAAAGAVGNDAPALAAVQLPINLLEPGGLRVAREAAAAGLEVLAARPLTGFVGNAVHRLTQSEVDARPARDAAEQAFFETREAALDRFSAPEGADAELEEACALLRDVVSQVDASAQALHSQLEFDAMLSSTVLPLLAAKFEGIDDDSALALHAFFKASAEVVVARAPQALDLLAPELRPAAGVALERHALDWLRQQEGITAVFVGMTTEGQVRENASVWGL